VHADPKPRVGGAGERQLPKTEVREVGADLQGGIVGAVAPDAGPDDDAAAGQQGRLGGDGPPGVAVRDVAEDPTGRPAQRLKEEDGLGIWLCGGGRLAGALLPEIDELVIKQYPVVAGAGIPIFAGAHTPTPFALAGTRTFDSGAVVMTYTRQGG
jgi:hypothetical protein